MKSVLTTGEAAKLCGLGVSTIKRWIGRNSLKAYRTPGGDNRIRREDLFDFMRSCGMPLLESESSSATPQFILLVALSDADERSISQAIAAFANTLQIKTVVNDFALGAILANSPLDYIVLAGADMKKLTQQCQHIRALIKPVTVRIGALGDPLGEIEKTCDVPEIIMQPRDDEAWAGEFIQALLGTTYAATLSAERAVG